MRDLYRSGKPGTSGAKATVWGRKLRHPSKDACWWLSGGGGAKGVQAPLACSECECGARHERREALDAAVQADPGLRDAAAALRGRSEAGDEGYRKGLYYP